MKKILLFCMIGLIPVILGGCNDDSKSLTPQNISDKLSTINGISDICIVTEDNDPNGNLNKDGGYTGALFFVYDKAPKMETTMDEETFEDRPYKDTCEKGTKAGGAIEIYSNANDAKERDSYLSLLDGTGALSPGSHTVLDTILIRTSSELKASEQNELEKKIIEALK